MTLALSFGLSAAIPEDKTVAWGARWIYPDDIVWDRTDTVGADTYNGRRLLAWLDSGALTKARKRARQMAEHYLLPANSDEQVTLYVDDIGCIVANPRRSFGYLYVSAWLNNETAAP